YQLKNTEAEAVFQYSAPPVFEKTAKSAKAPLELEWRSEKNQVETQVAHELKLRTVNQGWEIETTKRIQMKTLFPGIKTIDLKLSSPRPSGAAVIGTAIGMVAPGLAFPGNVPWVGLWKIGDSPWATYGSPDGYAVFDESNAPLKPIAQDAAGKIRVFLDHSLGVKPTTIVVKNKIRVPALS